MAALNVLVVDYCHRRLVYVLMAFAVDHVVDAVVAVVDVVAVDAVDVGVDAAGAIRIEYKIHNLNVNKRKSQLNTCCGNGTGCGALV